MHNLGQYKEWFYVNIYTKKSQWDRPTEPIYPPEGGDEAPDGPPPYDPDKAKAVGPEKGGLRSNNPFNSGAGSSHPDTASDEELARKLQAEEDSRGDSSATDRGEADSYYSSPTGDSSQGGYAGKPTELPPRAQEQKRGLFGKLLGKNKTSAQSPPPQQQQYYNRPPPQQPYYQQGPPPGPGYGYGPPPAGYGPPPAGYYPPGGPGYYGGGYQQQPQRQGMGAGTAAALGVGGGLLGGLLIGDALEGAGDGGDGGYGGDGGDFGGGGGDF